MLLLCVKAVSSETGFRIKASLLPNCYRRIMMNKSGTALKTLAIGLASLLLVTTQVSASQGFVGDPKQAKVTKRLLWKQEFTGKAGTKPSSKIFNYDMGGGGWGNNEHQAYTNHNAVLSGTGQLNINLKRISPDLDDLYEMCPIDTPGNACEFESSRLQTKGKLSFKYGRLEARIKVPVGDGTWPAFWLLGTDISTNAWPNWHGPRPWLLWRRRHRGNENSFKPNRGGLPHLRSRLDLQQNGLVGRRQGLPHGDSKRRGS
jgi:hypothetical protein